LTEENRAKLGAPLVKEEGGVYRVETYSRLQFTQAVAFDGKNQDEILIRQSATMPKGTIHKEMFISIASSITDQMANSLFANPVYIGALKKTESFIDAPERPADLNIELDFQEEEVVAKMYSANNKSEQRIPYAALFSMQLK
jgi:hypothetical protein